MPLTNPTEVTVLSQALTLTNAQIKALPTTSIEIVPAPGAGLTIVPFYAWFMVNWAADYSGIDALARIGVGYAGSFNSVLLQFQERLSQVGNLLADGVSHAGYLGPSFGIGDLGGGVIANSGVGQFQDEPGVVNTALQVFAYNDSVDFTGGAAGNSIKITVLYTIIDV